MEKFTQRETQQRTICDRYEKCECFECSDVACPSMTRPSQYYTSRDLAGPTHYDYKHEPPCITRTITFDYPSLPAPSAGRERGTTSQPTHLHQKSKYSHPTADGLIIHPKVNVPRRIPSCKTIEKDPNPEDVLFGRGKFQYLVFFCKFPHRCLFKALILTCLYLSFLYNPYRRRN